MEDKHEEARNKFMETMLDKLSEINNVGRDKHFGKCIQYVSISCDGETKLYYYWDYIKISNDKLTLRLSLAQDKEVFDNYYTNFLIEGNQYNVKIPDTSQMLDREGRYMLFSSSLEFHRDDFTKCVLKFRKINL